MNRFVAAASLLLLLSGCNTPQEQKKITKVEVDPASITIKVGEMHSMKVNVTPQDATYTAVEWSSGNEAVAQINKAGTLKAIAPGNTTVTATVDGVSGSCSVTVTENVTSVSGIKLSSEELTMSVGDKATLVATVEPADAANKAVTWSSTDAQVDRKSTRLNSSHNA